MNPRRLSTCCAALSLLVAVAAGCNQGPSTGLAPPAVVVQVAQPIVEKITDYDMYTGRTSAVKTVEVRARARGHLQTVYFQDGAFVQGPEEMRNQVVATCGVLAAPLAPRSLLAASGLYPGRGDTTLLFLIDPRPYQAALDQAKAQLVSAEANYKEAKAVEVRTNKLVTTGASTREQVDVDAGKAAVAAADVLKAKANLESARLDLDYTRVTAPITGRISKALVREGNLIAPETLLTTIVTVDPIFVDFPVDERALIRYIRKNLDEKGKQAPPERIREERVPVFLTVGDDMKYPHPGVLDFADNQLSATTGTILARAIFPNPERMLVANMFARVRIPVSDPYRALLVNERAINTDQGRKYVLVVNDQGIVKRREVTLGTLHSGLRVIEDGVKAGEWVIVNGVQRAREDAKVEVNRVDMPR
jgi:multidrug efflux system membrane fusion protein